MTLVGLYLFSVLTGAAGLLGHPSVLGRMARRALVWAVRRAARDRHQARTRPVPSWARNGGRR